MNHLTEDRNLMSRAIRRGHPDIVLKAFGFLKGVGDDAWLAQRSYPVLLEDCWMSGKIPSADVGIEALKKVALAVKNRDAQGLGFLAFHYASDPSVLNFCPGEEKAVKVVAAALDRTEAFFSWAGKHCHLPESRTYVQNIFQICGERGRWEKAVLCAAAYLCATARDKFYGKKAEKTLDLPLWAVFDRQTDSGKKYLGQFISEKGIPSETVFLAHHYTQTSMINESEGEFWWRYHIRYNFQKKSVNVAQVQDVGIALMSFLEEKLHDDAAAFSAALDEGASAFLAGFETL